MPILRGHTTVETPFNAVRDLHRQIFQRDAELVLFYASPRYNKEELSKALKQFFPKTKMIGCTTAGEIGPEGILTGSLTGVSFSRDAFSISCTLFDTLDDFENSSSEEAVYRLREGAMDRDYSFALFLIDGMSGKEESVSQACQRYLVDIPLVGGSAGDDLSFGQTWIYYNGEFSTSSALIALISTDLPLKVFINQHFRRYGDPLVVTEADEETRTVKEINGRKAVDEYKRATGLKTDTLTIEHFAENPLVVQINGEFYVRSIRSVNPDGSLSLYCAIERGVVLYVGEDRSLLNTRDKLFKELIGELGQPQCLLGFNCILCQKEMERTGTHNQIEQQFKDFNVVGFNTYGEQYMGMHMNQTFTGVAIGWGDDK